jgi:hypothetical protein
LINGSIVSIPITKESTMETLTQSQHRDHTTAAFDPTLGTIANASTSRSATGTSLQDAALETELNRALAPDEQQAVRSSDDHDHAPPTFGNFVLHADLNTVANPRSLNAKAIVRETSFLDNLGTRGDYINPRGGNNTVIGSGDDDVIRAVGRGFNTITTGTGRDSIILGKETTNRIFDFNPASDRFVLSGINPKNVIIAQGKNPGKGGLEQPLDSVNNALIIDKKTNHILAALPFVKAADLNESHFAINTREANQSVRNLKDMGFKNQRGNGQVTGTLGHDRLIGGAGDDFIYVGNDGFTFNTATGTGPAEFPFPNPSPGTSSVNLALNNGNLTLTGTYKDFDGLPLFSQGETTIDPNATILNGSDPVSLINGFLKVQQDSEGNPLSGTHLHFSPSGDSRGSFADATVVRFLSNTVIDNKSGTISGDFDLTPVEQAALLAGNFYINMHSNIDGDGDGQAGYPTGENRLNLNQNVVQFV